MRQLSFVLIVCLILPLNSCDDGDIIDFELDFDNTFEICEGDNDLVFYKVKEDPSESFSLQVSNTRIEDLLEVDENGIYEETFSITASTPLIYRTYSNNELPDDLFCSVVQNSEVQITNNDESTSGSALLRTVLVEDDNDGIPAELDIDPDAITVNDTDGDGLLNFIDADDDGDNVLTEDENPDPNGDGDLSDAQDTDNDGVPDYLDNDDDGDGVLTINEEKDLQDSNPRNDTTTDAVTLEVTPDYLNAAETTEIAATAYRKHTIIQTYNVTLTLFDFDLELISIDEFFFGNLENSVLSTSRDGTPEF